MREYKPNLMPLWIWIVGLIISSWVLKYQIEGMKERITALEELHEVDH